MSVMNDSDKLALAREMFQAWDVMDWTRVVDLFAEDGVLHSVMQEPPCRQGGRCGPNCVTGKQV